MHNIKEPVRVRTGEADGPTRKGKDFPHGSLFDAPSSFLGGEQYVA